MSRPHPSPQLSPTPEVEGTLEPQPGRVRPFPYAHRADSNNGTTNSVAVNATQPVTYRTRLYRLTGKRLPAGTAVYAIVRDTLEEPVTDINLPNAQFVKDFCGSSLEVVKRETDQYQLGLGRSRIIDWRDFGSF